MDNSYYDLAEDRLYKNFLEIKAYLLPKESVLLFEYLEKARLYGIENSVENAYFINGDGFVRYCIGDGNRVEIPQEIKESICAEANYSLTSIHNHPNSCAFSLDDYEMFLRHRSVKNMIVCGHNGNIYFMQKGLLFYEEKMIERFVDCFVAEITEMQKALVAKYCKENDYTIEELIASRRDVKLHCLKSVMDSLFNEVSTRLKRYDFVFCCEGGASNV
ncbi:MAG: hypothetical protein FWG87_03610 [Defluviitaleaceae bacterium]|nr:hypothetical protein [Defluviitaleaceae bacterium]